MWKIQIVIVTLLIGSMLNAQDFYRCYAYPYSDISVDSPVSWKRIVLAVPKVFPHKMTYPSVLLFLDKSGRKMTMKQQLYCRWDGKRNHYECGGEGDMGYLFLDKDMSLYFNTKETLGITIEVPNQTEQEIAVMDLKPGIIQTHPRKISCPPYVEQIFNPLRDGEYAQNGPLLHVCYTSKEHSGTTLLYKGCTMQVKSCQILGKKHFGYYQNSREAYHAFLRCLDGHPLR